jgi:hypothetical protein
MTVHVFVAAPYDRAQSVREFHEKLRGLGCTPTSHWATLARSPEKLESMSRSEIESRIEVNDEGLRKADVLVGMGARGKGGETFAEIARALEWRKPVLWCGPLILSAFRRNVYLCDPIVALACCEFLVARTRTSGLRAVHVVGEFFRRPEIRSVAGT